MTLSKRSLLISNFAAFGIAGVVSGLFFAPSASAEDGRINIRTESREVQVETKNNTSIDIKSESSQSSSSGNQAENEKRNEAAENENKGRSNLKNEKLSATKLQICTDRKANIDRRVAHISQRVTKQLELFDSIAERTTAFYESNELALDEYVTLQADVEAKKAAAKTAVNTLTSQDTSIDCEGVNPKDVITSYKATATQTVAALRDYRDALKNLISGIKSATAADTTTQNSTPEAGQ